ncbi:3-dehydroquinate synthase [Alloscardovia macacae]|uniref:Multifunctional fusion protein n=2 Tax=Alloscardovia macacae TaxID=1160091 RepID=A0A261F1P3_9BIFI|nr:bifunctional shikimate kinase/3-dehydroquinate synthase [Alloscardovia macacae]OZG53042.1 3-dehydroquinate synthase [Alloscardovia macacae]
MSWHRKRRHKADAGTDTRTDTRSGGQQRGQERSGQHAGQRTGQRARRNEKNAVIPYAVFIGMPGSGKTRIGREVANLLGIRFYDSDEEIERIEDMRIAEIFETRGEAEFRAVECDVIAGFVRADRAYRSRSQSSDTSSRTRHSQRPPRIPRSHIHFEGILSLGGGAPMNAQTQENLRHYARMGGQVIYLNAEPEEAIEHATRSGTRPLLKHNPHKVWMDLYDQRHETYAQLATFTLPTHGKTPRQAANTVIDVLDESIIHVSGASPEYDVHIGINTMQHLPDLLGDPSSKDGAVRVALIHTESVQRHSDKARAILRRTGYEVTEIVIPDAEEGKTLRVVSDVWDQLGELGFTRSDAIVGLGGGAATDVAGFIAATWLRGIRYVNCPTSLLAMVDASTGGKTGINTEAGKNLVGSFYTPVGVLADVDTLRTLSPRIFTEGLGEVVKAGFISDQSILRIIEKHADMLRTLDPAHITDEQMNIIIELISRSVRVKERHVSTDLKEKGLREFLNYGHTLGHAIEKMEHFTWRHGEAVAVGMIYAAELAEIHGIVDRDFVDYTRDILESVGLPTTWSTLSEALGPDATDAQMEDFEDRVLEIMHRDKKARGRMLRFVVVDEIGHARRLEDPSEDSVIEALHRLAS